MAMDRENEAETGWREPASSILATHLAPRLATQGHESISRETFAQLRQELLGETQNQLRVEEDVTDVNKLICIVLKAGLEIRPHGDAPESDLQGQVLDCLDIIRASIEKAPQALWEPCDPLIFAEDVQAPLYTWLILRLIRLANTWTSEYVREKIQLIWASLAYIQFKQARPLPASYATSAFLRACTSGLLIIAHPTKSIRLMALQIFWCPLKLYKRGVPGMNDPKFCHCPQRVDHWCKMPKTSIYPPGYSNRQQLLGDLYRHRLWHAVY